MLDMSLLREVRWVGRARTIAFWLLALLVAASIGGLMNKPAHADTFIVNSTSEATDFALDGSCDTDPRVFTVTCTLRAAIEEANNRTHNAGADTINFNIPTKDSNCNATTGVCTISPSSALPKITEAITIDGYTQRPCSANSAPCSKANTSRVGTNAQLLIQLSGANSNFSFLGLDIEASNCVVKGLVINRFSAGIQIQRPIEFDVTDNRIEGNFIGTNARGSTDLGNAGQGVFINSSSNNTVGGATRAARNLISGNDANGVVGQAGGTKVLGNYIGTDRTGTEDLGNGQDGLWLGWPNQTIGGDTGASANVIAFNGENGIAIVNSFATGNAILGNSIFSNEGLGIDLGGNGRTLNDPGDADTGTGGLGGNNFQNFPVITSAQTVGTTTIRSQLNSTPSTTFVVRFFSNPSGNEGRTFIGLMSVVTDASGNTGTFTFAPEQSVARGQRITATATDPGGNTSEFSAPREVTGGVIG